jgi:hypothetical protein
MTDDVSKPGLGHGDELPAWPEQDAFNFDVVWRDRDAYRARMEALVKTLRMVDPFCDELHHDPKDFHSDADPCPVRARIDALLAACEREVGR